MEVEIKLVPSVESVVVVVSKIYAFASFSLCLPLSLLSRSNELQ